MDSPTLEMLEREVAKYEAMLEELTLMQVAAEEAKDWGACEQVETQIEWAEGLLAVYRYEMMMSRDTPT